MAGELAGFVSQSNARVANSIEQLRQLIGGQSDDPFTRMLSMMQAMQQLSQVFGMPMPGMMPGGIPVGQAGGQPLQLPWQPPAVKRHSLSELEEEE